MENPLSLEVYGTRILWKDNYSSTMFKCAQEQLVEQNFAKHRACLHRRWSPCSPESYQPSAGWQWSCRHRGCVSFFVTQILGYQWTQKSSMILSTQAWNFGVNIGELFSSHTGLWNFSWSARSEHVLYPASFLAPSLMEIQTWFEWGRKQLQPIFTSFYYKESCCRFWCFWPICGFELF